MATFSRHYNSRAGSKRNPGTERALQHIREAKAFSAEVGGTDTDIKKYFFDLPAEKLTPILDLYERKYGTSAREYAEITIPKWASGSRKMSGDVAKRLFSLLPSHMPIRDKFRLVETLWEHKAPSSNRTIYIGSDVNLTELQNVIQDHFAKVVVSHKIPENLNRRFEWLSGGDVEIKQKLLNHMRQMERELAQDAQRLKIPMLMLEISRSQGGSFSETIRVGKHELKISYREDVEGIADEPPYRPFPEIKPGPDWEEWFNRLFWVAVWGAGAYVVFF